MTVMNARVGYARCSTDEQDVGIQIEQLTALGVVSLADLAEEYSVGRSTIHRIIHRPELTAGDQDR
jgi:DNA invertase Pin-like site-specific DNA recombinase